MSGRGALMGRNEYARHRGCSPNAVTKAEESGRILAAVERTEAGEFIGIRWRQADELWEKNTDLDQRMRGNGGILPESPAERARPLPARPCADVCTDHSATALARAVALGVMDWLEQCSLSGYLGKTIDATELYDLAGIFIFELAMRAEAALGPQHQAELLKLLTEEPLPTSIEQAIDQARRAVPGAGRAR